MKKVSVINATFMARGERGELRVINPIAPQRGHQPTLKTDAGEKSDTVPGELCVDAQLRAFVKAVRGEAKFPTDGPEGAINMRGDHDVYRAAGLPPRAT